MARPKFLMTLVISDLSNVPKPSGHCFVQWRVTNTLQNVKGRTPPAHIRDYRCIWKHSYESIVKLSTTSSGVLAPKELELEVYVVIKHHHHHHRSTSNSSNGDLPPHIRQAAAVANTIADDLTPQRTEKIFLGRVSVNLSEFCGEEGTTPVRYLLKDSKVNAVLSMEIGMTLIKGDQKEFLVPPLKSRGITTAFTESLQDASSHGTGTDPSAANSLIKEHRRTASGSQITTSEQKLHRNLRISTDPVVTRLYQKTFEMSWDPRPAEFTAAECVDDIVSGGDGWAKNEQGERFIDIQMASLKRDEQIRDRDVLREKDVRDEMKSWTITTTQYA